MFKKKSFNIIALLFGILLAISSFYLKGETLKSVSGIFLGVGCGLFGMCTANLYLIRLEKTQPGLIKQKEIEVNDERNILIREKAKAKAGDIIQWFVMGVAYVTIIINAPLWVTFLTIGVFLSYNVIWMIFMNKYQKEM